MADRSLNRPPHDIRARPVCQFFLKTAERRLLFLIPILHQTTTIASWATTAGWLFLIPILHQTTTSLMTTSTLSTLFLIPILHQTTTITSKYGQNRRCFSFQFYIKPQHPGREPFHAASCFSFQFYIKPQRTYHHGILGGSCFSFQFYIKPQHAHAAGAWR